MKTKCTISFLIMTVMLTSCSIFIRNGGIPYKPKKTESIKSTFTYPQSLIRVSFVDRGIWKENMARILIDSIDSNVFIKQNNISVPVYWIEINHQKHLEYIDEVKKIDCQIENGSKEGTFINIEIIENGIIFNNFWLGSDFQIKEYMIMSDKLFGRQNFFPYREKYIKTGK